MEIIEASSLQLGASSLEVRSLGAKRGGEVDVLFVQQAATSEKEFVLAPFSVSFLLCEAKLRRGGEAWPMAMRARRRAEGL